MASRDHDDDVTRRWSSSSTRMPIRVGLSLPASGADITKVWPVDGVDLQGTQSRWQFRKSSRSTHLLADREKTMPVSPAADICREWMTQRTTLDNAMVYAGWRNVVRWLSPSRLYRRLDCDEKFRFPARQPFLCYRAVRSLLSKAAIAESNLISVYKQMSVFFLWYFLWPQVRNHKLLFSAYSITSSAEKYFFTFSSTSSSQPLVRLVANLSPTSCQTLQIQRNLNSSMLLMSAKTTA